MGQPSLTRPGLPPSSGLLYCHEEIIASGEHGAKGRPTSWPNSTAARDNSLNMPLLALEPQSNPAAPSSFAATAWISQTEERPCGLTESTPSEVNSAARTGRLDVRRAPSERSSPSWESGSFAGRPPGSSFKRPLFLLPFSSSFSLDCPLPPRFLEHTPNSDGKRHHPLRMNIKQP